MIDFSIRDNKLEQAEFIESKNCSDRPKTTEVSLIVIHNISLPPGQYGGGHITKFFQNNLDSSLDPYFKEIGDLQVSSHLFIDRQGSVVQFVPFNKNAWHAGVSNFKGKENCNDFSIGIEMEGTDQDAYTNDQYNALCSVTKCLMSHFPDIVLDHLVGHADISPIRKTDPGKSFDWVRYKENL